MYETVYLEWNEVVPQIEPCSLDPGLISGVSGSAGSNISNVKKSDSYAEWGETRYWDGAHNFWVYRGKLLTLPSGMSENEISAGLARREKLESRGMFFTTSGSVPALVEGGSQLIVTGCPM